MRKTARFLAVVAAFGAGAATTAAEEPTGPQILERTGVTGGLIVHVGCGEGKLTADLHAGEAFLVHGVDTDAAKLAVARQYIAGRGLYGPVAVDDFPGRRLPYADDLATLAVAEDLPRLGVTVAEVLRVVRPGGVAYVRTGDRWRTVAKPRPDAIDEWTHYLHDATNNAVADDEIIGPPRRLQWVGSPRWARHHDRMASLSAAVSAGGRLFYIFDEGPHHSILLPPRWRLIARDAFNGTVLWKREIPEWHTHLWPFKSGPGQLPRRLIARAARVYVTLSINGPVTCLDAATGKTIRTFDATAATEEMLLVGDTLLAMVNEGGEKLGYKPRTNSIGDARNRVAFDYAWRRRPRKLLALDANSGSVRWSRSQPIVPLSLAATADRAFCHDGERIVCLAMADGKELWASEPPAKLSSTPRHFAPKTNKYLRGRKVKPDALARSYGATLVLHDGVVLFTGGDGRVCGLSANSGEALWSAELPPSGHYCPEDLLVVGGLVWSGAIAWSRDSGEFVGLDPRTGKVAQRIKPDTRAFFMHQRCYRSKATERFLIPSRTGTEFIDPATKHWDVNHWVRGGCLYGVLPCNGLLYATPHSCACYMESKLFGFNALAPAAESPAPVPAEPALRKGPAFGKAGEGAPAGADDWPTYRGNNARSGACSATVPATLAEAWSVEIGGRLTAPVVAGGRVFLAATDTHAIHSLDAATGRRLWRFVAGGRIDSPPTVWKGHVLFGCNDGRVYCLRAGDGELIWRFRAGPGQRRIVAFEQVESAWPVPGSVLVGEDGVARCVAGRSMFLDGGLRLTRLDAATGKLLGVTVMDDRDPAGKPLQSHMHRHNMPVALPDVLSTDGEWLYMRSQQITMDGERPHVDPTGIRPEGPGGFHLFSPTGFLDGAWWHRSYWVYGKGFDEGAGGWPQAGRVMPAGHVLAFDTECVYGYGRKPAYYKWTTPVKYQLFAMGKVPTVPGRKADKDGGKKARRRRRGPRPRLDVRWTKDLPFHVRAIALAGRTLLVAGPPAMVDEDKAFADPFAADRVEKLAAQGAALAGKHGGMLWTVDAETGRKLGQLRLDAPPAWDAIAVTEGRAFLATQAGRLRCLTGRANEAP